MKRGEVTPKKRYFPFLQYKNYNFSFLSIQRYRLDVSIESVSSSIGSCSEEQGGGGSHRGVIPEFRRPKAVDDDRRRIAVGGRQRP